MKVHGTLCHPQVAGGGIVVGRKGEKCYIGDATWTRYCPGGSIP